MKNFEPFVGKEYVITRHNKADAGPDQSLGKFHLMARRMFETYSISNTTLLS